jgi:hypothetical protein
MIGLYCFVVLYVGVVSSSIESLSVDCSADDDHLHSNTYFQDEFVGHNIM